MSSNSPFQFMQEMTASNIHSVLSQESAKVAAVVLNYLSRPKVAQVLANFDDSQRRDIVREMSASREFSPVVLDTVADALRKKAGIGPAPAGSVHSAPPQPIQNAALSPTLKALPPASASPSEDSHRAAAMSEALSLAREKSQGRGTRPSGKTIPINGIALAAEILRQGGADLQQLIANEEPQLFEKLRKRMFVFDDLEQSDARTLGVLFHQVDPKRAALALRFASDRLQQRVLSSISPRKADMIRDEIDQEGGKQVRIKDIEDAQQQVIDLAVQLQENGELVIDPRDPDLHQTR